MRLPRDISGRELGQALACLGYSMTHREGSHMRYTTQLGGEHHVTIPDHSPIRVGTFNRILREVTAHHALEREALLNLLFG